MAYQALYRKWRPVTFDDVRGQDAVSGTLKNQILNGRVGHAYLFCGTRGCGKTSVAKIMARAVNCPDALKNGGNPCNVCPVCRSIMEGSSLDVFEIDAASNNGVDNIRDIREQVEYPPTDGKYKVYIIDEVHMLSTGAFNALLKTLEEPPAYVIFILATTDPQKVPQTILSRCQRYDFRRMGKATISEYIHTIMASEGFLAEEKAIDYIADAADGSMRDSLSILDQCLSFARGEALTYDKVLTVLGAADMSVFSDLYHAITGKDPVAALNILDRAILEGKEPGLFVSDFIWYLRNVLVCDATKGGESVLEVTEDSLRRIREDARLWPRYALIRLISDMAELQNRMRFAARKRVLLEVELVRLTSSGTERIPEEPVPQGPVPGSQTAPAPVQKPEEPVIPGNRTAADAIKERLAAERNAQQAAKPAAPAAPQRTTPQQAAAPVPSQAAAPIPSQAAAPIPSQAAAPIPSQAAAPPEKKAPATNIGEKLEIIRANWPRLVSGLSPANRALFGDNTVLTEGHGGIVIVFKNKINFTLASKNEENGLVKLSNIALRELGVNIPFLARMAMRDEFPEEKQIITDEDLKKINFPVDIE